MSKKDSFDINNVDVNEVPTLIKEQFTQLGRVRREVEGAMNAARTAKDAADKAKEASAGAFHRKDTIETLQKATKNIADAQIVSAQAQEISFQYQQKLGEITKYLFGLGVSNIAANRSVVRELELRLKDASEEEIDELARQELISVVQQLKAQEDIMQKQTQMSGIVKEHDKRLAEQIEIDSKQDQRLDEGDRHDEAQDEELLRQANKDIEHDNRLNAGDERDELQDKELERQASKDEEHDAKLIHLENRCKELENELEKLKANKAEKILSYIVLGIAVVAIIVSLVGLFV